jgi:hypothetical protein
MMNLSTVSSAPISNGANAAGSSSMMTNTNLLSPVNGAYELPPIRKVGPAVAPKPKNIKIQAGRGTVCFAMFFCFDSMFERFFSIFFFYCIRFENRLA